MSDTGKKAEISSASVDASEVARFSAMAAEWWDPTGKFKPLHALGPVRLGFIRNEAIRHFGLDSASPDILAGKRLLDIGCGGGLLCEPMRRLGAEVTGLDPSEKNIAIAGTHAREQGLKIDYIASTAEDLAASGARFDIVLNMEVLEHVADMEAYLEACSRLLKPGGLMFCATLNRTFKSFALAIIGAEYVLRWLPRGTHQWERFITPDELTAALERHGLHSEGAHGMSFNPISGKWSISRDTDINYLMAVTHRAAD